MLIVRVFVVDAEALGEKEAAAVKRAQAACSRFAGDVECRVLDIEDDEALDYGVSVAPTIMVGDTVISVGGPPLAGQIRRFIELELEGA